MLLERNDPNQVGQPMAMMLRSPNRRWRGAALLVSRIHAPQTLTIAKDDLTSAGKSEHAFTVQLRERPRNGFQRKSEIVADIATAHRKRHHTRDRKAAIHLKQEIRDAFHGVL